MKRLHVHVNASAERFEPSVAFYTTLFGAPPSRTRENYAKWLLDEPRVNFVVENHDGAEGVHHVGVQVDDGAELEAIRAALNEAEAPLLEVGETTCCFSKSEKHWTVDPVGVRWEAFRSFGEAEVYGEVTSAEAEFYATEHPMR